MNPLLTTDEVRNGKLLAKTDDAEYRQVAVVYKLNGTDKAAFYCSAVDWPQTDVGRTAALYAEIERLQAKVVELEAARAKPSEFVVACPICHRQFKRKLELTNHMRHKHKGQQP